MALHKKTLALIENAYKVLQEYNPMTVRQVYYQLVARHVINNKRSEYQRLSNALKEARKEGIIPWKWVEDRVRRPQVVFMWQDLPGFIETVKCAYRKNIWDKQPVYIEVWLEKDALSGIFADITEEYGVTLVVGRGYNSWSAYKEAAERFARINKPVTSPRIEKVALTMQDIKDYDLPPDFAKKTDSRAKAFIKKHGDLAVELDALPLPVLQEKIRQSIEANMDMEALQEVRAIEEQEKRELVNLV